MGTKIQHPHASPTHTYKLFVNGKMIDRTDVYDYAMNRGLGIALYLNLDFINPKSKNVVDKWTDGKNLILITKTLNEIKS